LVPEPVSPELVLVDPELARRERARLVERAELAAMVNVATLRQVVETEPVRTATAPTRGPAWRGVSDFSRRRVVPAVLTVSLLANGLVAAHLVVGAGRGASSEGQAALQVATQDQGSFASLTTPSTSVGRETPAASTSRQSISGPSSLRAAAKASVERRLVSLIISAPAKKLPRRFVDATTGLVKNNVQVVCRRQAPQSFLCVIRPPNREPKEGLYVGYRAGRNGRGVFTWYGYRSR
jgi:hypothetical protein